MGWPITQALRTGGRRGEMSEHFLAADASPSTSVQSVSPWTPGTCAGVKKALIHLIATRLAAAAARFDRGQACPGALCKGLWASYLIERIWRHSIVGSDLSPGSPNSGFFEENHQICPRSRELANFAAFARNRAPKSTVWRRCVQ